MTTTPTSNDLDALRRAQQAIRAAVKGERTPQAQTPTESVEVKARPPKKESTAKPFDATAREAAVHRAVSLLRTMTEYYGITVGELEDESVRLRGMSDERLRGAIRGYEHVSKHVQVMLSDEKARDVAIAQSPKTAAFYEKNGVSEDDLKEVEQKSRPRRAQPA